MQKIGIIGGMGPYATVDFVRNILDLTIVKKDSDHIPLLIHCDATIPSRTRCVLYNEESPVNRTVEAINSIGNLVDFVALPCNSIHYWYYEISEKININWFNMLEVVTKNLKPPTLVIGSFIAMERGLYDTYIETCYLENKEIVYDTIEYLKLGHIKNVQKLVDEVKKYVKKHQVGSVLLACTELTGIDFGLGVPVVDTSMEYARKCVEIIRGASK